MQTSYLTDADSAAPQATKNRTKAYVQAVFEQLDKKSISYCVFRDYDQIEVAEEHKEIDLLVDPRHLKKMGDILAKIGFVEVPSWGHEPHNFFVKYIEEINMWLKLDVITALRFGKPVSTLQIDFTKSYLTNRIRREIAFVPAVEDKFLVLLLKCIINDKKFEEKRLKRLRELYSDIKMDPIGLKRIEKNMQDLLASAMSWHFVSQAFEAQNWKALLEKRNVLKKRLFWREPLSAMGRGFKTNFLKKFSPFLFMMKRRGVSIALLAPDGGGKSTLAKSLIDQRHLNARFVYMGENIKASNVGLPTTPWFKKKKKQKNKNPIEKIIVGAFNFPNTLLEQWYRLAVARYHLLRGRFVIYDRYIYDAWINPKKKGLIKKLRRLIVEGSYHTPDLVVFLDAPGAVLFARKGEHNPEWLEGKRQDYLALQKQLSNMVIADATQPPQKVYQDVVSLLWQYYGTRDLGKILNGKGSTSYGT